MREFTEAQQAEYDELLAAGLSPERAAKLAGFEPTQIVSANAVTYEPTQGCEYTTWTKHVR